MTRQTYERQGKWIFNGNIYTAHETNANTHTHTFHMKGNSPSVYEVRVRQFLVRKLTNPSSSLCHSHLMDCKHWIHCLRNIHSVFFSSFYSVVLLHFAFIPLSSRGSESRKGNLLYKFLNYIFFCSNNVVRLNENEYWCKLEKEREIDR